MIERSLLLDMDKVLWFFCLNRIEVDITKFDECFDVLKDFIGCCDLL